MSEIPYLDLELTKDNIQEVVGTVVKVIRPKWTDPERIVIQVRF